MRVKSFTPNSLRKNRIVYLETSTETQLEFWDDIQEANQNGYPIVLISINFVKFYFINLFLFFFYLKENLVDLEFEKHLLVERILFFLKKKNSIFNNHYFFF